MPNSDFPFSAEPASPPPMIYPAYTYDVGPIQPLSTGPAKPTADVSRTAGAFYDVGPARSRSSRIPLGWRLVDGSESWDAAVAAAHYREPALGPYGIEATQHLANMTYDPTGGLGNIGKPREG
ncbi:MAG: hypothetical protein ACYC96_06475 [Fimbriimonadaceae bacterium]